MKTPALILKDIERRLSAKWNTHLVDDERAFPQAFPLGRPSKDEMRTEYSSILAQTVAWQDWARAHAVVLDYENRAAGGGTTQTVPTHVRIESIEQAASVVGEDWPDRLVRGGERLAVLRDRYPQIVDLGRVIRLIDRYTTVDFELLLTVADWYLEDLTRAQLGATPRQVPVPGVHAKWLQSHQLGVLALTGLDSLGLLPGHPARIHFSYLDPGHRSAGRRIHDSATVGDAFVPAYLPEVVVISENKDTAIHFPMLPGGISVEGVGKGGRTIASFPWIRDAPVVAYWGDIDRDGLEILNGYRVDLDRDVDSILMDLATYEAYKRFGTNLDQRGNQISASSPKPVERLRADERELYLRLLDEEHTEHRRVEQERIPLDRALEAVTLICRQTRQRRLGHP